MPLYKDNEAERLARIEQMLTEVRPKVTSMRPTDHQLRRELGSHLDTLLDELRGPFHRHRYTTKPLKQIHASSSTAREPFQRGAGRGPLPSLLRWRGFS